MTRAAEWEAIQAAYVAAHKAEWDYDITNRVRYGASWRHYGPKHVQRAGERLRAAQDRAYKRAFTWLGKHSPWDWYGSGAGAHWIVVNATAAMVLGETAPTLPAEAAGYGRPAHAWTLASRTTGVANA